MVTKPVADEPPGSSRRVLDPVEHTSEILFGLIMVMACTGSFSVAGAGRAQVRTMLLAALGCNLAWGVIDAVFYLMGRLAETGQVIKILNAVRQSADPEETQKALAGTLPPQVASVLEPRELGAMCLRLKALDEASDPKFPSKDDLLGALGVFLLVFLSTFPVVIPFLFMKDVRMALHVSNAVAIVLLFVTGYHFGRSAGRRPVRTGTLMVLLGAALVGLTIALGG